MYSVEDDVAEAEVVESGNLEKRNVGVGVDGEEKSFGRVA